MLNCIQTTPTTRSNCRLLSKTLNQLTIDVLNHHDDHDAGDHDAKFYRMQHTTTVLTQSPFRSRQAKAFNFY
jgi:hypothetical protein